jgi:hypothetical protein
VTQKGSNWPQGAVSDEKGAINHPNMDSKWPKKAVSVPNLEVTVPKEAVRGPKGH